ncbi:MAG: ATP-dependent DNA helicase RecG [Bacteroidota bacterium]
MVPDGFLETKIEYLKGVGPQRADLLRKELGITTFGDLLFHFPFRYVDRTRYYTIREITADMPYVQIRGRITRLAVKGDKRRKHLSGTFQDDTGTLELKWFQGLKWIMQSLKLNTDYVLFGRPSVFNGMLNVVHPELETKEMATAEVATVLQPVYPTTEKLKAKGLDSKGLLKLQRQLHGQLPASFAENLPAEVISNYRFPSRKTALSQLHFPDSTASLQQAESRIKFEEFFYIQLRLLNQKAIRVRKTAGMNFSTVGDQFNSFYKNHLPFPLTEAQKRVIREIRTDCGSGKQMNRLLQGDVGSGKTVVALLSMLIALDNGYQACMMAPTEILAAQHAESINQLLQGTGLSCSLLTGSTRTAERKKILEGIGEGSIRLLVGTHALIEDRVRFKELGFVVIDEQHRFGVEQRARLWEKNELAPHILVMTATPIPRTLAMTLYGDLDVSVIDELPPGRKPVNTVHRSETNRLQVWQFLKSEVMKGRQAYIVYPLIEESEKSDLNNLMQGYEAVCKDFPAPAFRVSIVHGKMKPADKDFEMDRFKRGETQIMVATTVIEVGVNVPNASVMVIENAERFGLSQLHQLRGRVGRGAEQSYCILMTSAKLGNDARQRIRTMCETNDGFRIAETDLQLRGPGDAEGTRQSGVLDLRLADLGRDAALIPPAREAAARLLEVDPGLSRPEHVSIRMQLEDMLRASGSWGRIS